MSLFSRFHPALPVVVDRVAAVIKPGPAYVTWAQRVAKKDGKIIPTAEELSRVVLTILLPHCDNPVEAVTWLRTLYGPVMMMEMLNCWTTDSEQWPDPNTMVWEEWFRVAINSMIYDGGGSTLKVDKAGDLVARWKKWIQAQ